MMQPNIKVPSFHKDFSSFILYFISKKPFKFLLLAVLNSIEVSQSAVYGMILGSMIQKMSTTQLMKVELIHEWLIFPILYFSFGIFISVCEMSRGILRSRLMPWLVDEIRTYYFTYTINHSCLYFSQNLTGNLISRTVYIVDNSISVVELLFDDFIPSSVFILISIGIFYSAHPSFILLFLGWFACHVGYVQFRRSKYSQLAATNSRLYNNLMGVISDVFLNILQVKTSNSANFEISNFRKFQNFDINSYRNVKFYDGMTMTALDFIYSFWFCLALVYQLITKWLQRSISTSQVIHVNQTMRVLSVYIWHTTQKVGKLLMNIAKCKEALQTINIPHSSPDLFPENDFVKNELLDGSIKLDSICFSYQSALEETASKFMGEKASYLLDNFNLFIESKSRVAIVGSSGSGKSTVFQLIMRLIDPISGLIEMNGQDISKIGRKQLAQQFSFIPQKQLIFQRSIFENIAYGCEDIREYIRNNISKNLSFGEIDESIRERIVEASKSAHCHDFIINLKNGYDSLYGAEVGLSGGQAQRIMIARAFVNQKSKFLLLDEATSALDKATEQIIKESIDKLSVNRTVLMIAHKLDLVRDFDRILVFERGAIVEDGTHNELISLKGVYFNLFNS